MKILKFYSKTCGPCRVISNILKKVTDISVIDIDIADEANDELVDKYKIKSIPTLIVTDDGDNIYTEISGVKTEKELLEIIDSIKYGSILD